MPMVKLTLSKGLQFIARDSENHSIVIDTLKEYGGFQEGFAPLELLLVSLAGCMGMDIVSILKKKGGKVDLFEITIDGQKAKEHPKKYEKITIKFVCQGAYKREDLLRSFELSRDKYCGSLATLHSPPEIKFSI
jgi:putative redox protein